MLDHRSVNKFLVAKKNKPGEMYRRMAKKFYILIKKIFTNEQNVDLSLKARVEKTVREEETHLTLQERKQSGQGYP